MYINTLLRGREQIRSNIERLQVKSLMSKASTINCQHELKGHKCTNKVPLKIK